LHALNYDIHLITSAHNW